MNSLNYLSRQFDVLASTPPTTPPSTPNEKHVALPPPPGLPRNKSYARPRLPSTYRRESTQADPSSSSSTSSAVHHGHEGGLSSSGVAGDAHPGRGKHAKQRSFSSPSLFAARRKSILGVLSDPKASSGGSMTGPTPTPGSSSGMTEKQLTASATSPQQQLPGPPPLRRRNSHLKRKGSLRHIQTSSTTTGMMEGVVEEEELKERWLLFRALVMLWNAISALARAVGLVNTEQVQQHVQPLLARTEEAEKEESTSDDDDPIVARARPKKQGQQQRVDESVSLLLTTQDLIAISQPSMFGTIPSSITPPPLLFSLDPPSVEEVKRQTETPVPMPQSSSSSSSSSAAASTSSHLTPQQLLPNPLSTSFLSQRSQRSRTPSRQPTPTPPTLSPTPPLRKTPFHLPKTLVLDLDETLIHSTSRPMSSFAGAGTGLLGLGGFGKGGRGHQVEVVLGGRSTLYHVYKRPFVDYFLRKVSTWYTLVIFTASMQEYADPVIDWLDAGRGILGRRLFRESCTQLPNGSYAKDLSIIERDLSRICLVDNSPISYGINPANGIPIEGWISDPSDEALLDLLPVLDSLRFTGDVRRILGIRGFSVHQKEAS